MRSGSPDGKSASQTCECYLRTFRHGLMKRFALAPMSTAIRALTLVMAALPLAFAGAALTGTTILLVPALLLIAIYGWVWLRFRPTAFIVHPDALEVRWPLKQRRIARATIRSVRRVDNSELRALAGAGMRVGAGGMWGSFGWLWTTHRGVVQMYVSRTDGYVWIDRGAERAWLISPDDPDGFVRALR